MKKLLLVVITLFTIIVSDACPICGCGVGGFYIGLLPTYKSKFFGLRYQYSHYETHLAGQPDQFSHDYYHQAEMYGGFTIGEHWQLLGFIPYHFNHQVTDDGVKDKNGLGDITVVANYKVWKKTRPAGNGTFVRQEFWLGAGIKLATGKYGVNFNDSASRSLDDLLGDVNSQMGTGSTDFIFNAMYNIQFGFFGINTTANYKVNTGNSSHFKYGDRLSVNTFAYYQAMITKKVYAAPNLGILYEYATPNHLVTDKVAQTGGYAALASAGVDVNVGKITVGTNVQLPLAQNYAQGQTVAKVRGLVHLTYTF